MPTEEDIRSSFCKSTELHPAGDADTSDKVHLTFTSEFGSGISEVVLEGAKPKWILLLGTSSLADSDNWHDDGDLGEKKGDWFAEKKAEDDDDIFLVVMAFKDPNMGLSSWISMPALVRFPIMQDSKSHALNHTIYIWSWDYVKVSHKIYSNNQ